MILTKRAYDPSQPRDGLRILVDRLWPRGIKKEDLLLDDWIKDISPSNELRQWFAHDPAKWAHFVEKYSKELNDNKACWEPLLKKAKRHRVTLLYGAKDEEHNNAVALKQYLESKL
ncbi:MAG: DUF488 domain-containing protein [Candidatus Obscuribacterales bacterium]|nr:DUF488 domain-containing protein [Candidatus Obscuribacterales bacterium]